MKPMYQNAHSLSIFFVVFILFSCGQKQSDPSPQYYFQAKINGELFNYDVSIDKDLVLNTVPDRYSTGSFGVGVYPHDFVQLTFFSKKSLSGKPESQTIEGASYFKGRYEKFAGGAYGSDGTYTPKSPNGICTITGIDDHVVEGTFYFDVYSDSGKGNVKLSITDGHFRLKY